MSDVRIEIGYRGAYCAKNGSCGFAVDPIRYRGDTVHPRHLRTV
jgi:hypothetical protein